MARRTFKPILGKRIRVTQIDPNTGAPLYNTGLSVASEGFVTVTIEAEVEDGVEITQRLANGALCINEKFADSLKYLSLEIEFCGVSPTLLSIVSNAEEYTDGAGNVIGFTIPEGELSKQFAFEMWSGISGQASSDTTAGYLLMPLLQAGTVGEIAVEGEEAVTFSMTGARTKGGNGWGVGPYALTSDGKGLPTPLDPLDHLLLILLEGASIPANDEEEPTNVPAGPVTAGP